jgi:hypothetical protein
MTRSTVCKETSVPLYLLPRAIAAQINQMGASVYRISVRRTHWHHYNISVRVKALPKELAPARSTPPALAPAWRFPGDDSGQNAPCGECEA